MPGDVPVGAVSSPVTAPSVAAVSPSAAKAAKLASVTVGLAKLAETEKASAPVEATPTPVVSPDAPTPPPVAPIDPPPADEADPRTTKGLAAIEKQAKRFRDEQAASKAAAKAELDVERAEIARLRAEATGKVTSIAELKKMKPLEVLEALGFESEDDYDVLARGAYAKTAKGKADPRLKQQAEQSAEARDFKTKIAALEAKIEELGGEFSKRDAQAQTQSFVTKWQDEALKAIPAEPTLIGRIAAKSPEKAREVLLQIGKYLEKQTGETPTHAECIAEYEAYRRAELEEADVDVDALLRPSADAPKKAPGKSLDISTPGGTRPLNTNLSRAEKLAAVTAGLRKLESETA